MKLTRTVVVYATLLSSLGGLSCATFSRGPDLKKINENRRSTYRLDVLPQGHGSGVVISKDGYIITAGHVAVAADAGLEILIDEGDGKPTVYKAKVVAIDPVYDIAIVKVDRHFNNPASLEDMANLNPGDAVYNVGYPYDFGQMVGRGYIQKLHFDLKDEDTGADSIKDAILVDMPDGPGTSGSGVFLQRSGKLIGIVSMALWVGNGSQPPTVTRVLVSVEHVKALLKANKISCATFDGTTMHPVEASVSGGHQVTITIKALISDH
jgi:S1-C subfamily serine protease